MATKDWKKVIWGWINKKNSRHQINHINREKGTGILISKFSIESNKVNIIENRTFKSKSAAFKFAKSYMRKH